MEIKTIKTNWSKDDLSQNTYIIELEDSCVVVDAGCPIDEVKKATNKDIKSVFITHGHIDHIKYIEDYDSLNIPIYGHANIVQMLEDEDYNASKLFGEGKKYLIKNLQQCKDQQIFNYNDIEIRCIYTPGHTIDGMSYLLLDKQTGKKILFSGDTLFSVAIGRVDLPTGDEQDLINSLQTINSLDYDILLTGHGRESSKEEQTPKIPKWIRYLNITKMERL